MTKREQLYHSLVNSDKLFEYKLAVKKLRLMKTKKKPDGLYIDMVYLRYIAEQSKITVDKLLDLAFNRNILFKKKGN